MSVPGEQPSFYPSPGGLPYAGGQAASAQAPTGSGQMQPYGGPQPPVPYGRQTYPPPPNPNAAAIAILGRKSAGLAAVLSILLVGAGQMYAGHVGRGIAFLCASIFSYFLMFVVIGFITTPIIFIWALVDAVNLASRHNALLAHRLSLGGPVY